jgi:hypothetical protein
MKTIKRAFKEVFNRLADRKDCAEEYSEEEEKKIAGNLRI